MQFRNLLCFAIIGEYIWGIVWYQHFKTVHQTEIQPSPSYKHTTAMSLPGGVSLKLLPSTVYLVLKYTEIRLYSSTLQNHWQLSLKRFERVLPLSSSQTSLSTPPPKKSLASEQQLFQKKRVFFFCKFIIKFAVTPAAEVSFTTELLNQITVFF